MMSGHDWLKPQLRLRAMIGKSQQSQVFQLDMVYGHRSSTNLPVLVK